MIYDPARRALDLKQRILESMTAEELAIYSTETDRRENGEQPGEQPPDDSHRGLTE